jgi:hypothetical protein
MLLFTVSTNQGLYDLSANIQIIGSDLLISVWGGEKPHIGAVAISEPRPSLKDASEISASTSVFCFLGHKEDELAKWLANNLASTLNKKVVVTAGIHWDNISEEGIKQVVKNNQIMLEIMLQQFHAVAASTH